MTGKEYLEQLTEADNAIRRKRQRLETLRTVATNLSIEYESEAVQRTRVLSPLENIMAKIIDLEREIETDVNFLVDLKAEAWEQLDRLTDERYKQLLWLKYAERKTWKEIGTALEYTDRYARMLQPHALRSFEQVFEKK